jgi:predicted dehydrogenase
MNAGGSAAVRLGFVGAGFMGQLAHLRNYAQIAGCEVVALAEPRRATAELVADRYGIERVYGSHEQMLACERLDGLVVSQPEWRHPALLTQLYASVPALFSEKPLALTVEQGRRLAWQARQENCCHMVGYQRRSDPATVKAKAVMAEWDETGVVGERQFVRITALPGDWIADGDNALIDAGDRDQDPAGETSAGLREGDEPAFAAFQNVFCHHFNLMRHLLGEPYTIRSIDRSGMVTTVETGAGATGVIELGHRWRGEAWHDTALVVYEAGLLELFIPPPLAQRPGRLRITTGARGCRVTRLEPQMPAISSMRAQAQRFVAVCRNEAAAPCDADEAVLDLEDVRTACALRGGFE